MAGNVNHQYHILEPDIWPFVGSFSALTFTSGMVLYMPEMASAHPVRGLGIAGLDVGVHFLRAVAVGLLDRGEIGVGLQAQQVERAHFVGRARTVAAAAPAIMLGFGIACVLTALGLRACFLLGFVESFEIVPLLIVFGGMLLAKHPSFWAVRRLRGGTIARLFTAMTIAQPHGGSFAGGAISAPARKSPIVGPTRFSHGEYMSFVDWASRSI